MRATKVMSAILTLAALVIFGGGCERKVVNEDGGDQASLSSCFTCHGDDGYILAAQGEWQNSVHASGNNVDYTNREGANCTQCHDHQGFLDYLSTGETNAPYDQVSSIHCFTCHAPHTRGNLSLRADDAYTLANGDTFDHGPANLCVNCHHSFIDAASITSGIEVSRYWGPHHGPQGDLLNASNGYEYAGYDYRNTGHANISDNSGCIGCHMGNPQTHISYKIGGHSFNMVDEESGTTLVGVCQTCHTEAANFDYEGIQTEVEELLADLEELLYDAGVVGADGYPVTTTISDVGTAGALYNYVMIEEDRSMGVHNPWYIVDLLESSIEYMEGIVVGKVVAGGTTGINTELVKAH
nr:hypothetical protein [candidate division Zixibacteria bacterium]